jgi:D-amino-acid oxidase
MSNTISRRTMAKWLALSCATPPLLSSCTRPSSLSPSTRNGARRLQRVRVAPERVIREVVGLRPFRPAGFVVKAESFGDKTIIHNYGHGGGGVSLSWGTAQLAAELALATEYRDAAVLGSGAVGLSTARLLQDRGFRVTIYARDLPPNTTSNIAGAQWSPVTVYDNDRRTPEFDAQFVAASRFAYRYYQNLVDASYGVTWRENYVLSPAGPPTPPRQRSLIGDLLKTVPVPVGEHQFGTLNVSLFLTMHIEPAVYLPAVMRDFRLAGGHIVVRDFSDRAQVAQLTERLVVNCTGLGARQLFGDNELIPIKGQLVVLAPQAEVDYITIGPGDLYMMPRRDGIVLGGTHERGEWSLEPNPVQTERILRGHQELFAQMR